jgi:hypothetical protein
MLSKRSFDDRHYGLILVSSIVQQFGVDALHLLSIPTMCSPYRYMFISRWITLNACNFPFLQDDFFHYTSLSYPLPALTTHNGRIFDVLVMVGLKSMLSCLVGARLILILHMICSKTSAPIDKFACFRLKRVRSFSFNTLHELSYIILNPDESIYPTKICMCR